MVGILTFFIPKSIPIVLMVSFGLMTLIRADQNNSIESQNNVNKQTNDNINTLNANIGVLQSSMDKLNKRLKRQYEEERHNKHTQKYKSVRPH